MIEFKPGQIWESNIYLARFRLKQVNEVSCDMARQVRTAGGWADEWEGGHSLLKSTLLEWFHLVVDVCNGAEQGQPKYADVTAPAAQQNQCGEPKAPVVAPFFVWLDINHPNWRDRQDYELWYLGRLLAAYEAGQASKR
jgi:hypothetical protein